MVSCIDNLSVNKSLGILYSMLAMFDFLFLYTVSYLDSCYFLVIFAANIYMLQNNTLYRNGINR